MKNYSTRFYGKGIDYINPLPNDKISDWLKLKAFADDNLNVAKIMISPSDRVENIVGKGENAGYQHFLLSSQCFQKASSIGSSKVGIVWLKVERGLVLTFKIIFKLFQMYQIEGHAWREGFKLV